MYNADPNLDNDLKYINWTKDLDCFIDTLSGLSFNGPNLHQHKIAQGLAEALLMFPRPPNNKLATAKEYFMGERYCILVVTGDPIPLKMNVYVPLIKNGNFLLSQLKPLCANFLEVASIFGQLATGLSIITPTQYPMYREIFNSVSKVSHMENHPVEYRMDEITFLLSSNFKEAHNVLHEKGKTVCVTSPIISSAYLEGSLSPPSLSSLITQRFLCSMFLENLTEQIIDGVKNVMLVPENAVTPIHSIIPQATINQTFEPSISSSKLPRMNVFDDYMENLDNDDCYDSLLPWKKPKFIPTFEKEDNFEDFFLPEKPFMPFNDTLGQEKTSSSNQSISLRSLKEIEGEPTQVTIDIASQSVSKDIVGEWSSKGQPQELGGGMGIMSHFHISEKFSSSDISLPQPLVVSTFTTKEGSSRGQGQDLAASNMGIMNHFPTSKTSSSNFSFSQPMVQSIPIIGEGPSRGLTHELGGNTGVGNIIPTLENCSRNSFSFPQLMSPNLLPMGGKDWQCQSGGNNTTIRSGTTDQLLHEPPQISASLGNFMYPNSTKNLLNQFQSASSPSFSLLSYNGDSSNGSGNSSCHQFERHLPFKFTELSYLGTPRMREFALQRNIINVLPPPPFADIKDYVTAWEGCLVGRVHSYRACLNQARVMIKPTSPSSLISAWSSRLEIVIFIPTKAVTHTLKIIGGPINYVFFHITRFNNLDVYQHMIGKNLCAKIELPSETIILRTTTESKHHFLGIIVPRETIFVEPI
ncbi:hypothetical protein Fmac_030198 [Flemingia macrophylla]|uniref:Mediator of RNA polymerase II transcription subunit 25 n=1 Tax=Flemingia macrophylla TaxID=520843 RepID=A0ABD1LCH4_9FABA